MSADGLRKRVVLALHGNTIGELAKGEPMIRESREVVDVIRDADAALAEVTQWLFQQVETVARALAEHDCDDCFETGTPAVEAEREPSRELWRADARAAVDALVALARGRGE